MPKPAQEHAAFDLEAALDEIESRGCTVASFAREQGFPTWRLYEGLRRRQRLAGVGKKHARDEFVAVRLTRESNATAAFEVELRGGRTIRVPGSFEEVPLQRLVRALESC